MRAVLCVAVLTLAVCSALPSQQEQQSGQFIDGQWHTWDAIRNFFRPATTYISEQLPEKTPSEFAVDVRDAAKDFRDRARDHPIVQTVAGAVRPVHQWVSDTASDLSKTSFRDMYNGAVDSLGRADETVASWINGNEPQYENLQVLQK